VNNTYHHLKSLPFEADVREAVGRMEGAPEIVQQNWPYTAIAFQHPYPGTDSRRVAAAWRSLDGAGHECPSRRAELHRHSSQQQLSNGSAR
jgi:hypothetical protein